jgi:transcriptional regulator with XRE-family HTH domain
MTRRTPLRRLIRRFRKRAKLTQSELARLVCVSRSTVHGWESGRHEPEPPRLRALAQLLGLSSAECLELTGMVPASDAEARA